MSAIAQCLPFADNVWRCPGGAATCCGLALWYVLLTIAVVDAVQLHSKQFCSLCAGRFNERLVLSLAQCPTCMLLDDELNILPTSTHVRALAPIPLDDAGAPVDMPGRESAKELASLVTTLEDTQPAGALAAACKSLDQAKAVLTFLDAASEKVLPLRAAQMADQYQLPVAHV
jgi:tRNA(Met) C34 N-acetyltransferase TmcA